MSFNLLFLVFSVVVEKPGKLMVDIGFDDALRLKNLSEKHPDWVFIGMEIPRKRGNVTSCQKNLILEYEGGLEGLTKLPDESVKIVNMDLLFADEFTVTQWKAFIPGSQVNEVSENDLGWRAASAKGIFDVWKKLILRQSHRVLKPNGRLYISTYQQGLKEILGLLDEEGYAHVHRPSTEEEIGKTTFTKGITKKARSGEIKLEPEICKIIRIEARKKERKPKLLTPP